MRTVKEEAIRNIIAKEIHIFGIIGIFQLIVLIVLFLSPVLLIWFSWSLFWKVSLTAVLLLIITYGLYEFLMKGTFEVLKEKRPELFKEFI